MATATIKLLSTEQIITAELEIMNNIRNGIWINSKNEKITLFPYNENNLYFCIKYTIENYFFCIKIKK